MFPARYRLAMSICTVCRRALVGRQRKFCSLRCKNKDTNNRNQSYAAQQTRGKSRKLRLIEQMGSMCSRCGYARNFAALEFHHKDPQSKGFQLDLRSLSNRSWGSIRAEARKCILVCANCHAEIHNSGCRLDNVDCDAAANSSISISISGSGLTGSMQRHCGSVRQKKPQLPDKT